jgi:hypothetical protein
MQFNPEINQCVFQAPNPEPEPEPEPGQCPEGTYKNKLGMCMPCYFNCRTCIGNGMNKCTSCYQNAILYPEIEATWGRCVCRGGFWFDKNERRCVSTTATVNKPR